MKEKRGQQDIIVTVLLVLIAIAAVALIATFVIKNVKDNTNSADDAATCLKVNLEIVGNNATSVSVKRTDGEILTGNIKVIVDGKSYGSATLPQAGETVIVNNGSVTSAKTAEAAVVLANGYTCSVKATKITV